MCIILESFAFSFIKRLSRANHTPVFLILLYLIMQIYLNNSNKFSKEKSVEFLQIQLIEFWILLMFCIFYILVTFDCWDFSKQAVNSHLNWPDFQLATIVIENISMSKYVFCVLTSISLTFYIFHTSFFFCFIQEAIKTNEKAQVTFHLIKQPEYIRIGAQLLFREGQTKGMGEVITVYPFNEKTPHRWTKKKKKLIY